MLECVRINAWVSQSLVTATVPTHISYRVCRKHFWSHIRRPREVMKLRREVGSERAMYSIFIYFNQIKNI